jgi:hypothetical protein
MIEYYYLENKTQDLRFIDEYVNGELKRFYDIKLSKGNLFLV